MLEGGREMMQGGRELIYQICIKMKAILLLHFSWSWNHLNFRIVRTETEGAKNDLL